jgi:hypothetical protein
MFYIQIIHIFIKVFHVLKHNGCVEILKIQKWFSMYKFVIWISSWSTYVDYAPMFNNSYSYFDLSKYW